jgi:transcriptional regulator with GAF, ATPase, and Fis domain
VQARAARRLGISKSNLNYRINKLGISVRDVVYD